MAKKKASRAKKLIFGIVSLILFIVVGVVYLIIPFDKKVAAHIAFGLSSGWHIFIGIMIMVVGIGFFALALWTNLILKVDKFGKRYWYVLLLFDIGKWIVIALMGAFLVVSGTGVTQSILGR